MTALLRGILCAGLVSCPLLASDAASSSADSGGFWALIGGLMLTMFGGMAACYALVVLGEKVVRMLQQKTPAPAAEPPMRHAA